MARPSSYFPLSRSIHPISALRSSIYSLISRRTVLLAVCSNSFWAFSYFFCSLPSSPGSPKFLALLAVMGYLPKSFLCNSDSGLQTIDIRLSTGKNESFSTSIWVGISLSYHDSLNFHKSYLANLFQAIHNLRDIVYLIQLFNRLEQCRGLFPRQGPGRE